MIQGVGCKDAAAAREHPERRQVFALAFLRAAAVTPSSPAAIRNTIGFRNGRVDHILVHAAVEHVIAGPLAARLASQVEASVRAPELAAVPPAKDAAPLARS